MTNFPEKKFTPHEGSFDTDLIHEISQTYENPEEAFYLITEALKEKSNSSLIISFFQTERAALKSRKENNTKTKRSNRELTHAFNPSENSKSPQATRINPHGPRIGRSARANALDETPGDEND